MPEEVGPGGQGVRPHDHEADPDRCRLWWSAVIAIFLPARVRGTSQQWFPTWAETTLAIALSPLAHATAGPPVLAAGCPRESGP